MSNGNELKEENLATEILRDVKVRARKWMVAFWVVLTIWLATVGAFVNYLH